MNKEVLLSGLQNAPQELRRDMTTITDPSTPLDGRDGWNLHKTLFYLCETNEQVYIPRLHAIVDGYNPHFQDFDSDAWMEQHYVPLSPVEQTSDLDESEIEETEKEPLYRMKVEIQNYSAEDLDELVDKFKFQCDETVQWLEGLDSQAWERTGSHPVLGIHSLEWWVDRMLDHINNKLRYIRGD